MVALCGARGGDFRFATFPRLAPPGPQVPEVRLGPNFARFLERCPLDSEFSCDHFLSFESMFFLRSRCSAHGWFSLPPPQHGPYGCTHCRVICSFAGPGITRDVANPIPSARVLLLEGGAVEVFGLSVLYCVPRVLYNGLSKMLRLYFQFSSTLNSGGHSVQNHTADRTYQKLVRHLVGLRGVCGHLRGCRAVAIIFPQLNVGLVGPERTLEKIGPPLRHFDGGTRENAVAAYRPLLLICLLYTSPSPRDRTRSRMPSSA